MDQNSGEFVRLLTASQPVLYAWILSLLPDRIAAQDVLQETNLTLWRKAQDFEAGTCFMAWAGQIARNHVLNYRRKMNRDRLVFDDELFDKLCAKQQERLTDLDLRAESLSECLKRLTTEQRDLLALRYEPGGSVKQLAELRGQSVGAVSQALYRIRETLLDCVAARMQRSSHERSDLQ